MLEFPVRAAWSLTPVRVLIPGESRMVTHSHSCSTSWRGPTWSLMPIVVRVLVLGEDHTWSLTPVGVRVPTLGED